jgi:cytosine/adenosine deaminase-related metal-dependent hydrolase
VSKIGYLSPGLLVLYGTDGGNNDCKVLAPLQTVHLTLKLVRNGAPEKRRTISFVEQARGSV